MSTDYSNITLYGVEQAEVVTWCEENHIEAYISPTIDDVTVLYENILAENAHLPQPMEALLALGAKLSVDLMTSAMVSVVADDHMLLMVVYLDGHMIDHYLSYTDKPPVNGNAAILARTYDAQDEKDRIAAVLRRESIISATERHLELMDALVLPPLMIDMGFAYLEEGEKPHGVEDNNDVVYVGFLDDENQADTENKIDVEESEEAD